jgi:putative ABC transport system permease protein
MVRTFIVNQRLTISQRELLRAVRPPGQPKDPKSEAISRTVIHLSASNGARKVVAGGRFWGYTPKELVIRTTTEPATLVPAVRRIIQGVDPKQPISELRLMTDIINLQNASRAVQVRVLAAFAFIAFLLASIGIHGVLSFAVSQRVSEIGVRIALGARRRDILGMVMGRGVRLVAAGLLPGLLLAYFAGRSLESLLLGVTPIDVPTFATAAALTLVMAIAGTLLPTLRALRVDPITAIRAE